MDEKIKQEVRRNEEILDKDTIHYPEVAVATGWLALIICWTVSFFALPDNPFIGDHEFVMYLGAIQWFVTGIFVSVVLAGLGKIVTAINLAK
ncbi:hypothetical protein [Alteromonas sp. RKMC-009]|uniref:hypothetical protein n=1 Tax=Alteromonas sp. RKMC-009 TaxID=2267264 RepID=UPI000E690C21|nr:hypothetical protein [Alteromonas sp. RKMC-009]AYA63860.1 hypothetical protein DS731_07500 [Alteromonas sp. RKMC-009]